ALAHRRHLDLEFDVRGLGEGVFDGGADRLAPGVVGDDGADPGQALALDGLQNRPGHHRGGREAGPEREAAVRGEDGGRAGRPGGGETHVTGDDAAGGNDAVLFDEALEGRYAFLRVGLGISHHQLDHPPVDTSGGVDVVGGQLHPVTDVESPGGEVAGQVGQG